MKLSEALNHILESVNFSPKNEYVETINGKGRILAEDLKSPFDIPPFDNSQVDGYAVNSSLLKFNEPMEISQRIPAGVSSNTLIPNTVARIFTGAKLPEGANAVVMQEDVLLENGKVIFKKEVVPLQYIRSRGCDLKNNEIFFKAGRFLSEADIGMCSSIGMDKIKVFKKIKVAVFSSGDELVQPGKTLKAGQIYDSNRPMILGLVKSLGLETMDMGCIPDNYKETTKLLSNASKSADVILTCGGVSVGEEDHIKGAVEELGKLELWKIQMKPGKPFAFGKIGNSAFLGMPGNPVSAWVTFVLLCRPFLLRRSGGDVNTKSFYHLVADFDWKSGGNRQEFLRAKINDEGKLKIYHNQNSQVLSSICFSDGLVEIPIGSNIKRGDKVKFYGFSNITSFGN